MIVDQSEPLTLIGGAEVNPNRLERAMSLGRTVVAADSGADAALALGVTPDAVIGDFDSLSEMARATLAPDTLHPIPEQDSTDFDKCLRNISSPLVIGIGFSGDRLDHQLAAYNTLVTHPHRRCILLGAEELLFLCPPSFAMTCEAGLPVSLFPMGAVEGISEGLRWPINGLNFAPDGRIGTSNETIGPLSLSVTSPKMLVILPECMLESVAKALLATRPAWPPA